jgi:chromosome segregation ATPase
MVRKEPWQMYYALLLVVLLMVLGACRKQPAPAVVSEDKGLGAELETLRRENQKLKQDLARCRTQPGMPGQPLPGQGPKDEQSQLNVLEEESGKLKLLLLEKEAQMKEMGARQTSLHMKLDEAIQEVVRAKARLRSLESRAEAASNMAETEVALKMLKSQKPDVADSPEFVQAEQLLKMSTQEFRKENYGGALYLAGQAKDQIRL